MRCVKQRMVGQYRSDTRWDEQVDEEYQAIHEGILLSLRRARGTSLSKRKHVDTKKPAAKWISDARIRSDVGKALSVVLRTIGCSYALGRSSGCTMCSYLLDGSDQPVSPDDVIAQFESARVSLKGLDGPLSVKIYTSGSFLDTTEVPMDARMDILRTLGSDPRVREVVLESRPSFVTEESMKQAREALGDRHVEIGMGLESISDTVRRMCINKGFTLKEFSDAVKVAMSHNIGTRAYVLLKPPFLTERDSLLDSARTIQEAARMGVTTVSVNPVDVQRHTLVEDLWSAGAYRPPWLWTLVEILGRCRHNVNKDIPIVCDPVAAGKARGVHNCGVCDAAFVEAIRAFSLDQDPRHLENLSCSCKSIWEHVLEHEDLSTHVHLETPSR